MTWPSPNVPLPTDRLNATPQFDDHAANHNTTNLTINDDIAPQITQNQADIATNTNGVTANAANLADHENIARSTYTVVLHQPSNTTLQSLTATTLSTYSIRHGMCHVQIHTAFAGGAGATGNAGIVYCTLPAVPVLPNNVGWLGYGDYYPGDGAGAGAITQYRYDLGSGYAVIWNTAENNISWNPFGTPTTVVLSANMYYPTNAADT